MQPFTYVGARRLRLAVVLVVLGIVLGAFGSGTSTAGNMLIGPGEKAYFWPGAVLLTVDTSSHGAGYVRSEPYRIDCPTACVRALDVGGLLVVTATPSTGYAFVRWSGDGCSEGSNPCALTVTRNTSLVAHFEPIAEE
jgi:hypothetical protein